MSLSERKSALIVDDSRTARHLLGQMLLQHRMKVDMAESAEDALGFLSKSRPDVIFMDHMMPGMDGFQAVRAIKNNPATATIPIMMYTSQAGELYVGQARALGAVGVLPKQIKPVQVSDMLKSLHLIPDEPEEFVESMDEGILEEPDFEHTLEDVERMLEPADWGELHRWFEQMLKHHGQTLRDDIEASVSRLLKESVANENSSEDIAFKGFFSDKSEQQRSSPSTGLLLAAFIALALMFFWSYQDTESKWQTLYEQNANLERMLESSRVQTAAQSSSDRDLVEVPQAASRFAEMITGVEWTVNQRGTYGPEEIPLGDDRMETLDALIGQLRSLGFYGVVEINSHAGDFCDLRSDDGGFVSAPDDMPVTDCDRIGLSTEDAQIRSATQSVAFANYLAAHERGAAQDIRIQVNAVGNTVPLYPYPASSQSNLAGEWNRVAQQNNRVHIRLLADADSIVDEAGLEIDNLFQ
jgi:CheY-like chemotaxis protein